MRASAVAMQTLILNLLILLRLTGAAEWDTAGGEHCIDACRYSGDENTYHWCHTANLNGNKKWDYCVPTKFFHFDEEKLEWKPVSGNTSELGAVRTALYPQTTCKGSCKSQEEGGRRICETATDNPAALNSTSDPQTKSFYCSDTSLLPKRKQLTSKNGVWCIGACERDGDFYKCSTLLGRDFCSPIKDQTTKGEKCAHPCQYNDDGLTTNAENDDETVGMYFCFTSANNFTRAGCGYYPPEETPGQGFGLEFASLGRQGSTDQTVAICADQCAPETEDDPYMKCTVAKWRKLPSGNKVKLEQSVAYCLGHSPPIPAISMGSVLGIAIFVVAAAVVTACIIFSRFRSPS